jgi:cytochrome c
MIGEKSGSYIAFDQVDLTGINQIAFSAFALKDQTAGGKLEVRLGSPTGQLLGETPEIVPAPMASATAMPAPQVVKVAIDPTSGLQDVYLVYKKDNVPAGQPLFALLTVHFQNGGKGAAPKTAVSMK